jgi:hypothetical protein
MSAIHSAISGQTQLVQTIAVPREHRPTRIPSFPALERTSVLSFTDTFTLNTLAPNAQQAALSTHVAVIRDPVFPVWRAFQNHIGQYSVYRDAEIAGTVLDGGVQVNIKLEYAAGLVINAPVTPLPGTAVPLYVYGGKEYIPMISRNAAIEVTSAIDPGESAITVFGHYLNSNVDPFPFDASGVGVYKLVGAVHHYALTFELPLGAIAFVADAVALTTINGSAPGTLSVGTTTSNNSFGTPLSDPRPDIVVDAMLPITSATEYSSAPIVWQSTRANAVAVLFSNVSAVMQKEGTINCARSPSETGVNMFSYTTWDVKFPSVHPKERYYGPMEKGLYTFTLPDTTSELYHEYDQIGVGGVAYRHYLDGNRFAHLITFEDPEYSAALAVTVDRHVEFKSSSVLFSYGFSATPLEAYHQAQMALANLGVFFENPTHLATIASMAKAAIMKYGPTVARAALPYAVRGANQMLSTINAKLGKMKQAGFTQPKEKSSKKENKRIKAKKGKTRR